MSKVALLKPKFYSFSSNRFFTSGNLFFVFFYAPFFTVEPSNYCQTHSRGYRFQNLY